MSKKFEESDFSWPNRVGCILVSVVFPLIWIGNLVTTTDAGMAVPDWPNTYGYNLFAYPYREWFFGPWDLFVEHGHRLFASLAGLVAIVLVVVTRLHESRPWVRRYAAALLLLVIFQGVLGGVRVLFDDRAMAKIHGCLGPAFFAMSVGFCTVTSRWWREQPIRLKALYWVPRFAWGMLVVSYVQLVLGAFIRHVDDAASPKQFTLLVALHIMTAVLIVVGTWIQFANTRRERLRGHGVRATANALALLVLIQFSLGLGTWVVKFGWPIWFENYVWAANYTVAEKSFFQINLVTAHAAIGSLILGCWTAHAFRCLRIIGKHGKDVDIAHSPSMPNTSA